MTLRLVRYACPERHSRLLYGAIDGQLVLHAVVNRPDRPKRSVRRPCIAIHRMRVLVPLDLPRLRLEEMQNLTKLCVCHICPQQTILMALNTPACAERIVGRLQGKRSDVLNSSESFGLGTLLTFSRIA